MLRIPQQDTKKYLQANLGDTQGNLWSSFQLDTTSNLGAMRAIRSLRTIDGKQIEDAYSVDLDTVMNYAWFDIDGDGIKEFLTWAGRVLVSNNPVSSAVPSSDTNEPVYGGSVLGNGDMQIFNNNVYVTTDNTIKYHPNSGTTWTTISSPSIGTGVHAMQAYGDRLYIVASNAQKIYSLNTANTLVSSGSYTLDLSVFPGHISWIRAGSNRLWIGFTRSDGGRGIIFEWDGQSENLWSKNYLIEAQGSSGCTIWNDIPYVMDLEGRLLGFNGSNFEEVARLPFIAEGLLPDPLVTPSGNKLTHFNGLIYANDRILINISSNISSSNTVNIRIPSGVWEYTKENGLIHLASSSMNDYGDVSEKDYGQFSNTIAGAMFDGAPIDETGPDIVCNFVFASRSINDDLTTNTTGVYVDDINNDLKRCVQITTPWIEASQITDVWQRIIVKYNRLASSSDKIILKYRTVKPWIVNYEVTATWTSQTTFTASGFGDALVGDEVTVCTGYGAGDVAHITNISVNAGVYTVTLDNPIIGVSNGNSGRVIIDRWIKLREHSGGGQEQFIDAVPSFNNQDTRCQFKIVAKLTQPDELYEIVVVNKTDQFAK